MDAFDQAFRFVIGHEGSYTREATNPAHWTGGRRGVGACSGTNWGISAAAYPDRDIAALTLTEAQAIYRHDYWDRLQCDQLPAALALLVFDAAVSNGVRRAARWLQIVANVPPNGEVGLATLAAIDPQVEDDLRLCAAFQAQRLLFMTGPARWRTSGDCWARRLSELPFEAMQMDARSETSTKH